MKLFNRFNALLAFGLAFILRHILPIGMGTFALTLSQEMLYDALITGATPIKIPDWATSWLAAVHGNSVMLWLILPLTLSLLEQALLALKPTLKRREMHFLFSQILVYFLLFFPYLLGISFTNLGQTKDILVWMAFVGIFSYVAVITDVINKPKSEQAVKFLDNAGRILWNDKT